MRSSFAFRSTAHNVTGAAFRFTSSESQACESPLRNSHLLSVTSSECSGLKSFTLCVSGSDVTKENDKSMTQFISEFTFLFHAGILYEL
ncbi:hypothetical protein DNTS_025342 [Danionella cerebrum]|uniref:Uncharacterized protein n=1 Tax=Danionella cerebrum TaxID=2873325 RepID=A0A553NKC5_9TELE|nr:hypothetical protein DNTS_025342 [Danionella translucida]